MYAIKICSTVLAMVICYLVSVIIHLVSLASVLPVLILLVVFLVVDIVIYKMKGKKAYLSLVSLVISVITFMIIADVNISLNENFAVGVFLLILNIVIAYFYSADNTMANTPVFHDAVFGKRAGKIASVLQYSSTLIILHSVIYVGNLMYTIISFFLLSLLVVVCTQLIISPRYKEYKKFENEELKAQIKKEQGNR